MARINIFDDSRYLTGTTTMSIDSRLPREIRWQSDLAEIELRAMERMSFSGMCINSGSVPIKEENKEENLPRFEFKRKTNNGIQRICFKSKYGEVDFCRSPMPSNCGIVIMSSVIFSPTISPGSVVWKKTPTKDEYITCVDNLMREFDQELDEVAEVSGEFKNKIIMTDSLEIDLTNLNSMLSIHYFCKLNGWTQGKPTYNRNSGNEVAVFERDRYDVEDTRD